MSIQLGPDVRVVVAPPVLPPIVAAPPSAAAAVVVPVRGPQGPKGDPGDLDDLEVVQDMIDTTVAAHGQAAEPHTAYDDLPSLRLIFENGLI